MNININTLPNNKINEIINEEVLYNSLCFLPFELLLDALISIGYENDIDQIGNSKTSVINRLVNDARELGIEDFIQRLDFNTITETCSLLSLSGVNGDTDDEILNNSRKQLEDKMKKDSLDQFFFSLTPHILYQFCNCLKINLPPPSTIISKEQQLEQQVQQKQKQQQQQQQQDKLTSSESEEEESKTITNSIPSIKVGSDGTTVLSTLSTKSSYKKFKKNRGISYGDSIVEGQFFENIIKLVKEEILISGSENLFSFLSKSKLISICEHLKIIFKPNEKMSELITKIISKLFNIENQLSSTTSTTSTTTNRQPQQFTTPIKQNNKNYPKTPLSPDESGNNIDDQEEDDFSERQEQIVATTSSATTTTGKDEKNKKNSKNKRKHSDVEKEQEEEAAAASTIMTETDDSEIDQPAKRPSIIDIKMGIKKQDLETYLVKDLRTFLQLKNLKYNDKKAVLVNRILKYLENESEVTSASENELLENNDINNSRRVSKRLKQQQKEQQQDTTTTTSTTTSSTITTIESTEISKN